MLSLCVHMEAEDGVMEAWRLQISYDNHSMYEKDYYPANSSIFKASSSVIIPTLIFFN